MQRLFNIEKVTDYRLEQKFGNGLIDTRFEVHDAIKKMRSKKQ